MNIMITVTLLTQEHCAFCDQAKELLGRLVAEYPITVETVAITSTEGQRLAATAGIIFPPGLLLDGEPFSYGRPSERKLRRALERRIQQVGI